MSKLQPKIIPAKIINFENKLVNTHLNTNYYSISLAKQREMFIDGNRLIPRWQQLKEDCFVIGELGFDCGINFLLAWQLWQQHAPKKAQLYFISSEKHPLTKGDLAQVLRCWPNLSNVSCLIEAYPILTSGFHCLKFDRVTLILMLGNVETSWSELLVSGDKDLESLVRNYSVDAWFINHKNYYPKFIDLATVLAMLSKPTATLVSASTEQAQLSFLYQVGFKNSLSLSKSRDYSVLDYTQSSKIFSKFRKTPWHWHQAKVGNSTNKKAIVIGAGLAGCYTAHALANRGWQIVLLEANKAIAQEASGNQQAILYPKLSAYSSPLLSFLLMSFLYASRVYQKILIKADIGELKGVLQLPFSQKEAKNHQVLQTWLVDYPELGYFLAPEESQALTGILLEDASLFLPKAGWLNMPALCQWLIQSPNIQCFHQTSVEKLTYDNSFWHVAGHKASTVIIANGHCANQWLQTNQLPLKAIRGQTSQISTHPTLDKLKIPICAKGHLLPKHRGTHTIGATYRINDNSSKVTAEDDQINLDFLAGLSPAMDWPTEAFGSWSAVRAATPDYLPLLGPVPKMDAFTAIFQGLRLDSNRWVNRTGVYYPGLYINSGFGSRGLTTIPLSAEWLASLINQEPSCLPRSIIQAVSPARFLIKKIIKAR